MRFNKYFKKKLSAVSLAEVLVVLAITAVTLVSISQLTVQLLVTIKNDEVLDYTTGISIQALEIAKSAEAINLVSDTPIASPAGFYTIDFDSVPATLRRVSALGGGTTSESISDCNIGSEYYVRVDVPEAGVQPVVCMQIILTEEQDSLRQSYYLIEAVSVTKLGDEVRINRLKGYRRGEFNIYGQEQQYTYPQSTNTTDPTNQEGVTQ
jgi:hypothetical protein